MDDYASVRAAWLYAQRLCFYPGALPCKSKMNATNKATEELKQSVIRALFDVPWHGRAEGGGRVGRDPWISAHPYLLRTTWLGNFNSGLQTPPRVGAHGWQGGFPVVRTRWPQTRA